MFPLFKPVTKIHSGKVLSLTVLPEKQELEKTHQRARNNRRILEL